MTIDENIAKQIEMAGYTKETAAVMENTLFGRVRALSAAFEEMYLSAGDAGASAGLRMLIDLSTSTARALGGATTETDRFAAVAYTLSLILKVIAVRLAAILVLKVASGVGLMWVSFLKLATVIKRATASMRAFKVVMAANWVGLALTAIAGLVVAWQEYASAQDRARESAEALAETELRIADSRTKAAAAAGSVSEIEHLAQAYADLASQQAKITGLSAHEQMLAKSGGAGIGLPRKEVYTQLSTAGALFDRPGQSVTKSRMVQPTAGGSQWLDMENQKTAGSLELQKTLKKLLENVEQGYVKASAAAGEFATTAQLRETLVATTLLRDTLVGLASEGVAGTFAAMGEDLPNFEDRVRKLSGEIGSIRGKLGEFSKFNESGKGIGGADQIQQIDKGREALEKYSGQLQFELAIVNKTAEAQKRARIERDVANQAAAAGVTEGDLLLDILQQTAVALYEQSEAQKAMNEAKSQYMQLAESTQESLDSELAAMQSELSLLNMTVPQTQALGDAKEREVLQRTLNASLIGLEGEALEKAFETTQRMLVLLGQLQEAREKSMGGSGVEKQTDGLVLAIAILNKEFEKGAEAAARYAYEQDALGMATHLSTEAHGAEVEALMLKYDEYHKLLLKKEEMDEQSLISNEEFARAVTSSVMSVVTGASTMQEAFLGLIQTLIEMVIQALIFKAIMTAIGGPAAAAAGGAGGVAKGGVYTGGSRQPFQGFATGGIVDRPTRFGMYGNGGVMGEAGSEAIMPLTRLPDGSLGVKAQGGSGGGDILINMTVNTSDADSFRKSKKQITRELSRGIRQNAGT